MLHCYYRPAVQHLGGIGENNFELNEKIIIMDVLVENAHVRTKRV